jgi:hypothetical protein
MARWNRSAGGRSLQGRGDRRTARTRQMVEPSPEVSASNGPGPPGGQAGGSAAPSRLGDRLPTTIAASIRHTEPFHFGSGFIEPEAEGCGEGDGSPEGVGARAMSDIDVPPAPWGGRTCSRAVGAADRAVRDTRSNAGRDAPIGHGLPEGNGTASALVSRKRALRGCSITAAAVLVSLACSTLKCSVRKAASTRSVGS